MAILSGCHSFFYLPYPFVPELRDGFQAQKGWLSAYSFQFYIAREEQTDGM